MTGAAGESISVGGVRSCSGIVSSVVWTEGVRMGKGKGYNRLRAANAMLDFGLCAIFPVTGLITAMLGTITF